MRGEAKGRQLTEQAGDGKIVITMAIELIDAYASSQSGKQAPLPLSCWNRVPSGQAAADRETIPH